MSEDTEVGYKEMFEGVPPRSQHTVRRRVHPMTADTLTGWLLEQIAEDERVARAQVTDRPEWRHAIEDYYVLEGHPDPARVLVECAAKRAIVELHAGTEEFVEWFDAPEVGRAEVCPTCRPADPTEWHPPVGAAGVRPDGFVASYVLAPCPTLRALATVYADRPGFREEWRV